MRAWFPGPALLLGWVWLCFLGGAALLMTHGHGADAAKAYFAGTAGRVTPLPDCAWIREDKASGWHCHGAFTGGDLSIGDVRIRPLLDSLPTGPVTATVSGPDATTAWAEDGPMLLVPAGFALLMAAVPVVFTFYVVRDDLVAAGKARRRRHELQREIDDLRAELRDIGRDLDG